MTRRVLITGPVDGLARYAEAARRAGWEPVLFPLLRVERRPLEVAGDERPDWICVTSANALPALTPFRERWADVPCAAVGPRTAGGLRELGFRVELEGSGTALELAESLVRSSKPRASVLWPRGGLARDLGEALRARGFDVRAPVVYATVERDDGAEPPPAEAVLLASPSAVRAFARRDRARSEPVPLALAIGPTTRQVVEKLKSIAWTRSLTLETPSPEAFEACLRRESR